MQLKISTASTYGHLGLLWDYAYGRINIGPDGVLDGMDTIDIAMAAEWTGDADVFVAALCDPKLRFLDVVADGVYAIHDYQDWAPDFVCKRWRKDPSKYGLQKPYSKSRNNDADVAGTSAVRPSPTQGQTQDVLGRLRASQVRSTQPNPTQPRQGRPDPDQPNPKKPDPGRPTSTYFVPVGEDVPPEVPYPSEKSASEKSASEIPAHKQENSDSSDCADGMTGIKYAPELIPAPETEIPTHKTCDKVIQSTSKSTVKYVKKYGKVRQSTAVDVGEETGPDLIFDSAGSDRTEGGQSDKRFVQVFAVKVCCAAKLSHERSLAEKRAITAVGRTIANRADRDAVAEQLIVLAGEKAGAHLDNPMAAWQAEVNKLYPPDSLARPPTRNRTRRNMSMSNT